MLRVATIACLAATMMTTGVAFAQTATTDPTTSPKPAATDAMNGKFVTEQSTGEFRASKFVGLNVYGADNQAIGDINEILIDATGSAKAVVIGVGGFLGIGEKNVAVPFTALEWVNAPAASASNATPAAGTTASPTSTGAVGPAPKSPAETAAANGYPDHAMLRMTKADLQAAPDFKYYAQTQSNAAPPAKQ